MLTRMVKQLQQIGGQLNYQNLRWQNIETKLENQNVRMNSIEQQITNMNNWKHSLTKTQTDVNIICGEVTTLKSNMNEYDQSIKSTLTYVTGLLTRIHRAKQALTKLWIS